MRKLFLYICVLLLANSSFSQSFFDDNKTEVFKKINISGSYRFFLQHREFVNPYITGVTAGDTAMLSKRAILVGDATQLPELTLNISANPSPSVAFGTDLTIWNQNTGEFDYFRGMQLGVNLYGSFKTDFGNYNVKTGGIHWVKLSRLTLKQFEGYNRYSLFERNPWDPQAKQLTKRYADYYQRGSVQQDERWGNQAFHGFAIDGAELPENFSFSFLYGKAQTNVSQFQEIDNSNYQESIQFANTQFYESLLPSFILAGQLKKQFKKGYLAFNTMNGYAYKDSLALETNNYSLHSASYNFELYDMQFIGEIAASKFNDMDYGTAIVSKLNFPEKYTFLPIALEYFYVGSGVYNNNSEIINTSIQDGISSDPTEGGVLQQNGSAIVGVGQLTNNRTGITLNSEFNIGKVKINFGQTISKELERITSNLTYGRKINSVTLSEFYRWQYVSNVGPYGRLSKVFRGAYETVTLDNKRNGEIAFDKYFNSFDLQAKYEYSFLKRKSYCFYLGSFNSAQSEASPFVVFDESAYIRQYTHQLENYLSVSDKTTITTYLGYERVIGNYETDIDDQSFMPRNQEAIGIGLGADIALTDNTALYIRHRYFSFEDRNFVLDNTDGHETTLEIKVNF